MRQNEGAGKRAMTEEEAELRKEAQIKQKKKRRKVIKARIMLFLLMFAAVAIILFAAFMIDLHLIGRGGGDDIKVYIMLKNEYDEKKTKETYTREYFEVIRNGTVYVDFSDVAETFGMTVTGDKESLRYIPDPSGNEYAVLTPGSGGIVVNGAEARLSNPVIRENGKILVPREFFDYYVNSIRVEFDGDGSRLLILREFTTNSAGDPVGKDISFRLKNDTPLKGIDFYALPEDIVNKTKSTYEPETEPLMDEYGGLEPPA